MRTYLIFIRRHLEAFIWIGAIIALAATSPVEECMSLCPFHHLGFSWCPGCGLGHSISWLFRGEIIQSFNAHPLGIPAVMVLTIRVIRIFRNNRQYYYSYKKSIQHG